MNTTNKTAIDALTPEQIFEIAAPHFAWNVPSWHKATQGMIGMPNLLDYSRALAAALAPQSLPAASDASAMALLREVSERDVDWLFLGTDLGDRIRALIGKGALAIPARAGIDSAVASDEARAEP